ncbi:PDZ domain-containing protein [bacterium]|nr:PDZ domain-containing protein [bacterium]
MKKLILAVLLTLPGLAQEPTWREIKGALQKSALNPVTSSQLDQAALQEIRQHLPASSLEEAWDQHPEAPLLQWCARGAAELLHDPYLTYLEPESFRSVVSKFDGDAQPGPGFSIVKDGPGQPVRVLEVEANGPQRLHAGDVILSLNGHSTADLSIEAARAELEGPAGSLLHLNLAQSEMDLPRLQPDKRTVTFQQMDNGVGYLRIRNFAASTPAEVKEALGLLHTSNVVIDLRNNGGGLVSSAVQVCSNFLPGGSPVVRLQRRDSTQPYMTGSSGGANSTTKVVVVINHESASAAEIMASALHDHGRATLVGTTSFGKGCVQRYLPLPDGGGLKFTSALYQTPAGHQIQGTGITPDIQETLDPLTRAQGLLTSVIHAGI